MILARLATTLREQAWTTFAIEFVLVIAGVLIALEVDNWNQERVEARKFRRELQLLRAELDENRVRLDYAAMYAEREIERLSAFQRAFHSERAEVDEDAAAVFLSTLMLPGPPQLIRSAGVDRVLGSDDILETRQEQLLQHLEDWNRTFTGYLSIATDLLQYRNRVILPLLTESHSQHEGAKYLMRLSSSTVQLVEREDEPLESVLADPRVENMVVFRLALSANLLDHVRRLDDLSVTVIGEIDPLLDAAP